MSKGRKRREAAERREASKSRYEVMGSLEGMDAEALNALGDFFFADLYGPLESLTDELIDELTATGWPREDLIQFRSDGFMYSRKRHSITAGDSVDFTRD